MEDTGEEILKRLLDDPVKLPSIFTPYISDQGNQVPTRWIKRILKHELKNENPATEIKLLPTEEEHISALERPSFTNLLTEIGFLPPKNEHEHWTIQASSRNHLLALHDFFLNHILCGYLCDEECKVCKKDCKSLIQHLKKKASCGALYADDEMEELRIQAKLVSKTNAKSWKYWNKDKVKASYNKFYEQNKSKKAAYYQNNKGKLGMKMAEYHSKNYKTIASRKSSHYYENKKPKEKQVESASNSSDQSSNYSLKRQPINFNMDDLETDKEDENDDEFKATIGPLEKKILPERKCTQKILNE